MFFKTSPFLLATHKINGFNSDRGDYHDQTLREIIFLIYSELSSQQIAEALNFSKRTIDKYREHISEYTGAKNIVGVAKYAIKKGINNDVLLNAKFLKYLLQK